MAAKMTEAEFAAMKKKSGYHEKQEVKVYYEPTNKSGGYEDAGEKERAGLKRHADRREQNRQIRDKALANRPFKEKAKDAIRGGVQKVRNLRENIIIEDAGKAFGKSKTANPIIRTPPDSHFMFPKINPMNIGLDSPGIAGPPAWMMGGGGLGMGMGMGNDRPQPPRRKPKRRKRRRDDYDEPAPRRRPQTSYQDLGGIPPEVRKWMF